LKVHNGQDGDEPVVAMEVLERAEGDSGS